MILCTNSVSSIPNSFKQGRKIWMKAKESTYIHLIDYSLIVSDNLGKLQGSHLFLKGRLASSLK